MLYIRHCNLVYTEASLQTVFNVCLVRDNWPAQRVEVHFSVIQVGIVFLIVCDRVEKGHTIHRRKKQNQFRL